MLGTQEHKVELQPAYILHQRPFQENKHLVELLTKEHGRIGAVVRSPRGKKRQLSGRAQPFSELLVDWYGKADLKTLGAIEFPAVPLQLKGDYLLSGFYVNEILMRLLIRGEPVPEVFKIYQHLLENFEAGMPLEPSLRQFEYRLLTALGYGFHWNREVLNNQLIEPNSYYKFTPNQGFKKVSVMNQQDTLPDDQARDVFSGQSLLEIEAGNLLNSKELTTAKKVMQLALQPLLGPEPLKSREIFRQSIQARSVSE